MATQFKYPTCCVSSTYFHLLAHRTVVLSHSRPTYDAAIAYWHHASSVRPSDCPSVCETVTLCIVTLRLGM